MTRAERLLFAVILAVNVSFWTGWGWPKDAA
jgi:hypothetical protein